MKTLLMLTASAAILSLSACSKSEAPTTDTSSDVAAKTEDKTAKAE